MIITKQFVFIHVHKTGGQSLNEILQRCMPECRTIGYHMPRADLPAASAHLPVVGMIRNPWDWYVSWYAFNRRPGIRNPLFQVVADGGAAGFRETVSNLVRLGSSRPKSLRHRQQLEQILPDSLDGNRGVGLTKASMHDLEDAATGYFSWLFARMIGPVADPDTFIGRFENLRDDFLDIMQRLSVDDIEELRRAFDECEPRNASRHSHYSHYYDNELKQLVGEQDSGLIERFEYEFASVKKPGATYEYSTDAYADGTQGFRKLLGREQNFLRLNDIFDVEAIRQKVELVDAEKWHESDRERIFDVHRDTQALLMVHFEDHKYKKPDYREMYADFERDLAPVLDYVANYYQDNGFVVRLILARLIAGGKIPKHTDAGYSLLNCHRIHLPITTNDDVVFFVGGKEINMRAGELWEINNGKIHAVENRGDEDRVHLIVDWIPNHANDSEESILIGDQPDVTDSAAADTAMLSTIIGQAYQLHQAGKRARAEALYRQVLHFDADHVFGNNLLGLLCLQTERFDEAVQFIGKALTIMPDDAQARSNLGLALNALNRPDEAAREFHESLKLNPRNARVYNNLGNIYLQQNRIKDAIHCYQQALAIQPDYAEVHVNLGSALLKLRRYSDAATSLQQGLALNPGLQEGRNLLQRALRGVDDNGHRTT